MLPDFFVCLKTQTDNNKFVFSFYEVKASFKLDTYFDLVAL